MTERELDIENLRQLQKEGKIRRGANIEAIADLLPKWRKKTNDADRYNLACYGRDQDLDELVDDEDLSVRWKVARRGRPQDLDVLANDKSIAVRQAVAEMQLLTEADEKGDIKGRYYMDQLFGRAMDNAHELHFESIEQHVAVHALDALERIANALEKESDEDSGDQTLTYKEFCKEFNALDHGYRAYETNNGGVNIVSKDDNVKAKFYADSHVWYFKESGFYNDELALMTKLATTPLELRN